MNAEHTAPPIPQAVPTLLSFVAGYVDGCTFLALFGLFVAQVTGSFVVAGAELAAHDEGFLIKVLAIPVFFGAGVVATVIATLFGDRSRTALVLALALEAALLATFLWLALTARWSLANANSPATLVAALLGLAAMGVQSATVRLMMKGYASTNVMTTNTTQLAIDVTDTLFAWRASRSAPGDAEAAAAFAAARSRLLKLLPLVLGFLLGTVAGAFAYVALGFVCLTAAISILAGIIGWVLWPRNLV